MTLAMTALQVEHILGIIVLSGAAAAALWRWLIKPLWKGVRGVVYFSDATPVLMEIAEQFKPNAGTSLRDTVDRIERRQDDLNDALVSIEDKIDTFLINRQPGGQRATD